MRYFLTRKKLIIIFGIVFISVSLTLYLSQSFFGKKWHAYQLNKEFVCPEMQTEEESNIFLYKYIQFYKENYPEMTFSYLLGIRMELLLANNCVNTLQNVGSNNNGIMPDKEIVKELKNIPHGPDNPKLSEI